MLIYYVYVCAYESVYVGMLNMYAFLSSVLYVCLYMCGIYSEYNIHSIWLWVYCWLIFSFVATVVYRNPKRSTQCEGGRASGSSNNNGIFDDFNRNGTLAIYNIATCKFKTISM